MQQLRQDDERQHSAGQEQEIQYRFQRALAADALRRDESHRHGKHRSQKTESGDDPHARFAAGNGVRARRIRLRIPEPDRGGGEEQ